MHRTRDKGVTWEKISPDLTAFPQCCQGASGEPITRDVTGEEFYSTLYAITESPLEKGVIWTGVERRPVPRHARQRQDVDERHAEGSADGRPRAVDRRVAASPGSAYFAVYRYLLGDYAPYIYRTDDYGKTWTRLTDGKNGIPADWPTRVVREDPDREGLLYAGTEFGMFISFDNGAHWQPFQLNLPNVPITDIKVHQKDLVVATQGRAFWILDNLTPLHQITPQIDRGGASSCSSRATAIARDGRALLGPTIEYYLPAAPTGPVTIEILDAAGARRELATAATRRPRGAAVADAAARRRSGAGGSGRSGCRAWPVGRAPRRRRRRARHEDAGHQPLRVGRAAPVRARPRRRARYQARLKVGRHDADAAVHRADRSARRGRRRDGGGSEGAVRSQHADARSSWPTSTRPSRACARRRRSLQRRDRRRRRQGEAGGRDCGASC